MLNYPHARSCGISRKKTVYASEDKFLDAWEQGQVDVEAIYWHKGLVDWQPIYKHDLIANAMGEVSIKGSFVRTWDLLKSDWVHVTAAIVGWTLLAVVLCAPLIWYGLKVAEAQTRGMHSMVAGGAENVVVFELPSDERGWRIGEMTSTEMEASYTLVRANESGAWSDRVNTTFLPTVLGHEELSTTAKAYLTQVDPTTSIDSSAVLDDGSHLMTYTSSEEKGMLRFLQGSDGIYMLSYSVNPSMWTEGGWDAGREVVLSGRLGSPQDHSPVAGLNPDRGTRYMIMEDLSLSISPLDVSYAAVLPWPVVLLGALLIYLLIKMCLDCLLYYFARCVSGEIKSDNWSEMLGGMRAWKGLVKFNLWAGLIYTVVLAVSMIPLVGLMVVGGASLGRSGLGSILMLISLFPLLYICLTAYYGPLVVIDRATKTFGGQVNAWRAFWDTRTRMAPYWKTMLAIIILCSVATSLLNGVIMAGATLLASMLTGGALILVLSIPFLQMLTFVALSVNYRAMFPDESPDA